MKVLLTGAGGQLGKAFGEYLVSLNYEVWSFSREELDITNFKKVLEISKNFKPHVIINCAAYNLVDKAEEEFEKAFSVNVLGVQNLAIVAQQCKSFLIHFSTDYVFDGTKGDFYLEEDIPSPINTYGKSKLLGEIAITNILESYLIFRVSWVFGKGKRNFLVKVLDWCQEKEKLYVSCDEFSIPTYVNTIAEVAWKAFDVGLKGLYHLTGPDFCSRLEWAKFFLEKLGIKKKIIPVRAEVFNLPARRPFFSALDSSRLEEALGIRLPSWREEVERFAEKIKKEGF